MKNHSMFSRLLCLLFICSLGMGNVIAQIVPASNADIAIATDNAYLNNAIIDYTPNCNNCGNGSQFTAVAISRDPSTATPYITVLVDDGVNSTYPIYITGYTADVIVGQSVSNSHNYQVGVVYAVAGSACGTGAQWFDIYLDVYEFTNVGQYGICLLANSTTGILISNGYTTANPYPHIDIEPQYSTMTGYYPQANNFAIAFTDQNYYMPATCPAGINPQFGINIYTATLDNPTTPLYLLYQDQLSSTILPKYADVSFREISGPLDDLVYTFTDQNGKLYIKEHYLGTPGGSVFTHNPYGTGLGDHPRIDVDKDLSTNTSGSLANYLVVDDDLSTGEILAFSNQANAYAIGCYIGASAWDYNPVVAFWYGAYAVGFYHNYDASNDMYLTEYISGVTGIPYYTNYYLAVDYNTIPVGYGTLPCVALNCTCNGIYSTSYFLANWNDNYSGNVYNKQELILQDWKHSHTGVPKLNMTNEWTLSPNPATDHLLLQAPAGDSKQTTYSITDITGRGIIQANMCNKSERISIGEYASGMYMLHVYEEKQEVKTLKFVKQ